MAYVLWNKINPGGQLLSNICIEGSEVKYVKDGDGVLFYDSLSLLIYDIPRVFISYPSIEIPPEGGSIGPNYIDYRQTWRRVGYSGSEYELDEIINEGATINYEIVEGEGATVDSNGIVTWESRDTEYGASARYAVVQITVTMNNKSESATAVVALKPNIITDLRLVGMDLGSLKSLPECEAWESSILIESNTPASSRCLLTFSSGDTIEDYDLYVDFEIEYTWSSNKSYVIIDPNEKGESCIATVESRRMVYDSNYRTATITRLATIIASLKPRYKEAISIRLQVTTSIDILQKPNLLFIKEFSITSGSILGLSEICHARGGILEIYDIESSLATGILEFSSLETTTDLYTYGSLVGPMYSWESDLYFALVNNINGPSTIVFIDSRGAEAGPERSAVITRYVYSLYTLLGLYGGHSAEDTKWCSTSVTQDANYINKVEALIDNPELGDHFYYPSIDEYGGVVAPLFNGTALYWYASDAGPFLYDSSAEGSWDFTRTYYVVTSNEYASLDPNGYITWSPNTVNDKLYVTIGSVYNVKCSSFGHIALHSITGTATAMMEEIKIVITYYPPTIHVEPTIIPAKGGEIKYSDLIIHYTLVKETINYAVSDIPTYEYITEGGDVNYWLYDTEDNIVDKVVGEHLGKNITPRTYKGHVYVTVTLNDVTGTLDENIYLQANNLYLNADIDNFYYNNVGYKGGTAYPNLEHSCQIYFTSGSSEDWTSGYTTYPYGTLTSSVYYSASYNLGSTFDSSTGSVEWESHSNDWDRSIYVTAYLEYTFQHSNGLQIYGTDDRSTYSTLLKRPEKEVVGEWVEATIEGDTNFSESKGDSHSFTYTATYYVTWLHRDGSETTEYKDVTRDLYDYGFSVKSGNYFSAVWYGTITTKEDNKSGSARSDTLSLYVKYPSPNTGYMLYGETTTTISQISEEKLEWHLTITSSSDMFVVMSTDDALSSDVAVTSSDKFYVQSGSPCVINVSDGVSVREGIVTKPYTNIYIYRVIEGHIGDVVGGFVYKPNGVHENYTVGIA